MKSKENVTDEDVDEMISEYRSLYIKSEKQLEEDEPSIIYKGYYQIC